MGNLCSGKLTFDSTGFALDLESIPQDKRLPFALDLELSRKQYDKRSRKAIDRFAKAILEKTKQKKP